MWIKQNKDCFSCWVLLPTFVISGCANVCFWSQLFICINTCCIILLLLVYRLSSYLSFQSSDNCYPQLIRGGCDPTDLAKNFVVYLPFVAMMLRPPSLRSRITLTYSFIFFSVFLTYSMQARPSQRDHVVWSFPVPHPLPLLSEKSPVTQRSSLFSGLEGNWVSKGSHMCFQRSPMAVHGHDAATLLMFSDFKSLVMAVYDHEPQTFPIRLILNSKFMLDFFQ